MVDYLCNMLVNMCAASLSTHTVRHRCNGSELISMEGLRNTIDTSVSFFLRLLHCLSVRTHLERNGEHQHSKDKSPEGPVPKHLQGKRGRGGLVAASIGHPYHPASMD